MRRAATSCALSRWVRWWKRQAPELTILINGYKEWRDHRRTFLFDSRPSSRELLCALLSAESVASHNYDTNAMLDYCLPMSRTTEPILRHKRLAGRACMLEQDFIISRRREMV